MTEQHKQDLMRCTDFSQLLDAEYGKRGTAEREKFEADAIDMAVEMSLEDMAAGRCYTQEQAKQRRTQFADSLFQAAV